MKPSLRWWQTKFSDRPDAVCVSQGGSYCAINMPGLVSWLSESDIPFALICHSHRIHALPPASLRSELQKCFGKAFRVCFVAEENAKAAERFLGARLTNRVLLQNPVNLPEEREMGEGSEEKLKSGKVETLKRGEGGVREIGDSRWEMGQDGGRQVARMACVARLDVKDKGQDLLLEVLSSQRWRERDFSLTFYGDGSDRPVLEDLIRLYNLGTKVRLAGHEGDIRKIWHQNDLLVLPSISEGTPITLIEAQLCARPALVTRVDGSPDWVEDEKTGFIAESPSLHHLCEALERAWENRSRWLEMGAAARSACLAKRDADPAGTLLRMLSEAAESSQPINSNKSQKPAADDGEKRAHDQFRATVFSEKSQGKAIAVERSSKFGSRKLVFISTLYEIPWGGSENLWSSSALRALEAGHDVTVFVSERSALEGPLARLKAAGARLHFWRPKYAPLNAAQRLLKKVSGRRLPEWEWWHRNLPRNADAFCLSQGGIFCGLMRHGLTEAIRATNRPYVVLARCDTGSEFLDAETRPEARTFLEGASAFVAASRSTIDLVKLYLPSEMANARALHSPIKDASQGASGYPADDIYRFACVGRLRAADKGQGILLACLASEAWKRRPFRLTFYGEGPDQEYLQELTSFFGLGDRVEFGGHLSDLGTIWRDVHLAIQPSFAEGSPQSLLESMLCRRACVATSVGGIPEWVEDGKTGFLAAAPSVRHMSEALERAWEARDRWQAMGEAARERCLAQRDPDPAGTLLGLLQDAAARR